MISISLNGELYPLNKNTQTVSDLISQLDLSGKRFAIEINEDIITRSEYESTILKNDDQVEIVQAIGGG